MVLGLERRRLAAVIQASMDRTAAGAPPLQRSPRRSDPNGCIWSGGALAAESKGRAAIS